MTDNAEQLSPEMIDHILGNLDGSKLTEWEVGFIRSVKPYWKRYRRLSEKQSKRLKEIWEDQHNAKRVYKSKPASNTQNSPL
jgi:hypothetical protein